MLINSCNFFGYDLLVHANIIGTYSFIGRLPSLHMIASLAVAVYLAGIVFIHKNKVSNKAGCFFMFFLCSCTYFPAFLGCGN